MCVSVCVFVCVWDSGWTAEENTEDVLERSHVFNYIKRIINKTTIPDGVRWMWVDKACDPRKKLSFFDRRTYFHIYLQVSVGHVCHGVSAGCWSPMRAQLADAATVRWSPASLSAVVQKPEWSRVDGATALICEAKLSPFLSDTHTNITPGYTEPPQARLTAHVTEG